MLSTRDPPQNKRPTQAESEGMKKYFMKMDIKKSWGNNIYIRQNRQQNKHRNKRQRRSLHNT